MSECLTKGVVIGSSHSALSLLSSSSSSSASVNDDSNKRPKITVDKAEVDSIIDLYHFSAKNIGRMYGNG
jgi:hypothetical protein